MNLRASSRARRCEELYCGTGFDQSAAVQQHNVAGYSFSLAEIVGRHHYLDATCADSAHDVLDRLGGVRDRDSRSARQGTAPRDRAPARARAPVAAARRRRVCRAGRLPSPSSPTSASSSAARFVGAAHAAHGSGECIVDIAGGCYAGASSGRWNMIAPFVGPAASSSAPGDATATRAE